MNTRFALFEIDIGLDECHAVQNAAEEKSLDHELDVI